MPVITVGKIDENKEEEVNGGAAKGYVGGYCPYTYDRNCRIEAVGTFDNENEECKYCGYRAW